MSSKKQLPYLPLNQQNLTRIIRADFQANRGGNCLGCGQNWEDCPHDTGQIHTLIEAAKVYLSIKDMLSLDTLQGIRI